MAGQQSTKHISDQQPMDKAVGLLSACFMVVFGGWTGLRPETILWRAIVVGCVVMFLFRLMTSVVSSSAVEDD